MEEQMKKLNQREYEQASKEQQKIVLKQMFKEF